MFTGFLALTEIFGNFLVSRNMVFLRQKDISVWINRDIFANYPEAPAENSEIGKKDFVLSFLQML